MIKSLIQTHNFADLLRFFKYNMGSALLIATIERAVQRELQHKKEFPARLFFGAVGVGIMIFMIFVGAIVFMQAAPSATSMAPPNLLG